MSILVFSMIAFPLFLPEDKTSYCLFRSQQPGYLFYITNSQRNLTRRHKYPLVYSVHRDSYYSLRSAVDHEAEKFVDIFFLICSGKVELVTGEGDRLNLKSKLSTETLIIH